MAKAKVAVQNDFADDTQGEVTQEVTNPGAEAEGKGKAPKATRAQRSENDIFKYVRDPEPDAKFPPQMRIILEHIKDSQQISRSDLSKALEADEKFVTRQPVARIVTFYQNRMVENGIVSIEKQ